MAPTSTLAAGARTLYLVRHGESTWNTLGLTQGHNDEAELTARGERQAADVAARLAGLPVGAIYSSDLRRAQQTASAISDALGIPVVLDSRLRERSLGVLEGTPADGNGPPVTGLDLKAGVLVDPDTSPEGGESVRDLYERAAGFADFLRGDDPSRAPSGHIIAVAHGGTLRVLRAYLSGIAVEDMDWGPLENATVLEFPFGASTREGTR